MLSNWGCYVLIIFGFRERFSSRISGRDDKFRFPLLLTLKCRPFLSMLIPAGSHCTWVPVASYTNRVMCFPQSFASFFTFPSPEASESSPVILLHKGIPVLFLSLFFNLFSIYYSSISLFPPQSSLPSIIHNLLPIEEQRDSSFLFVFFFFFTSLLLFGHF